MPSTRFNPRALFAAAAVLAAASAVNAIGDFPCAGSADSQSCSAWSTDPDAQGEIAATAVCQPDPINTSVSYCGYAHAACTSNLECDYGSCSNGQCAGYLGDACSSDNDCQAFFFCGSGTCGGAGAACANGDPSAPIPNPEQQCVSQTCDTTNRVCGAPPAAGVANGFGCSNNAMCASGFCNSASICAVAASQGGSRKKRSIDCPANYVACPVGSSLSEGYECVDVQTDLEQCGGCVTNGEGQDCTDIFGAETVTCETGRCLVLSCAPGMSVNALGTACL
ncbi:hypothetical protein JCM6882_001116 [Rhodosporidiobolus microsporus]